MSFSDNKLEMAILSLVIVLIGGLGYLFKTPVQAALATAELIYEMPRPKSFFASFFGLNLEGREVSRKYVNPFEKKKADAKKAAEEKSKANLAAKPADKKKADAKKTADAAKKPKVEMKVVGKDTPPVSTGDIGGGSGSGGGAMPQIAAANNSPNANDKGKDSGMSADQWRALISGQPTKENVAKLINAHETQEVDDATFYTIVSDLLRNNKSETQALGLYAATSVYSTQSFATVASHYDQLSHDNQSAAKSYLMSYATSSHTNALLGALKTNNATVVELATQVVIQGYQAAKSGTATTSDPRNARGNVNVSSNPVADYSKFIPIFQQLAQSSDAAIASLANSALSQIQSGIAAN
ncbi:MAG TPA: hypothetical protein VN132_07065 [Bdellovibrio sp.]|nr:hypothetical protein [Bdellovibrio sp.]